MKHLLFKLTGLALAMTALILAASLALGADTAADPLVSLSYLNGKYRADLLSDVDVTVAAARKQLSAEFSSQLSTLDQPAAPAPVAAQNDYRHSSLNAGQTVQVGAAGELLIVSGTAKVTTAGLVDATAGASVPLGSVLAANHLYLANEACTIEATAVCSVLIK